MRGRGVIRCAAVALWLLPAVVVHAAEVTCQVKYLSAENVYLDAGGLRGLVVGLRGQVVRGGEAIGEIEVVFVADHSASCTVASRVQDFVAGDSVVFTVTEQAPVVVPAPVPVPTRRQRSQATAGNYQPPRRQTRSRLRGSVAVQWDHGQETNGQDLQTNMYLLPFRLQMRDVWRGFDFRTRGTVRRITRRGFRGATPHQEWRNRIQEVSLVRDDRRLKWNFALGRIGGRMSNAAGPFDGVSASLRARNWLRVGAFGGFAPTWADLGFGTDDQLAGGYMYFNWRTESGRVLDMVTSAIGRYHKGEVSREYLTMTTTWRGNGGLSLVQAAEVDVNRKWRYTAAGTRLTLSSLALTGRYRFNRRVTINMGYDDRDPVRTWQTHSLPDSLFRNAGRKGWRSGVRWRPQGTPLTVSADGSLRSSSRSGQDVTSWNMRVAAPGLTSLNLYVFGTLRGFSGPMLSGWAPSIGVTKSTRAGLSLRTEGGHYSYTGGLTDATRTNTWVRLAVDKDLTRKLSGAVEYRQDWGSNIEGRRWFLELREHF